MALDQLPAQGTSETFHRLHVRHGPLQIRSNHEALNLRSPVPSRYGPRTPQDVLPCIHAITFD
jgi:hypothetical protein